MKYKTKQVATISGDPSVLVMNKSELQTFVNGKLYGYKYSSELRSLDNETEKQKTGLEKLFQGIADESWIRKGLSAVPFIGAAFSLYEYFTAGGTSGTKPLDVKIQPMSIHANITFEGDIVKEGQIDNWIFDTPGSNHSGLNTGEENAPIYDQVLGTFNILRSPTVRWLQETNDILSGTINPVIDQQYIQLEGYWDFQNITKLKLKENIEYVINPAAQLKTNAEDIDLIASIEIEFENYDINVNYVDATLSDYKGHGSNVTISNLKRTDINSKENEGSSVLIKKNPTTFYSRDIPIQCLNDLTLKVTSHSYGHSIIDFQEYLEFQNASEIINAFNGFKPTANPPIIKNIWINLIASMKRNDIDLYPKASNALFKGKYKVNLEAYTGTTPNIDFASSVWESYPESITLENTTINSDLFAWGDITIGDNVSVGTGGPYKVTSGGKIIINSSASNKVLTPNLILQNGVDKVCTNNMYLPVSQTEISRFCSSSVASDYKKGQRIPPPPYSEIENTNKNSQNAKTGLEIKTELYDCKPNPANSSTSILYYAPKGSEINFDISNIFGEVVIILENTIESFTGEHSKVIDTSKFPSGTYFVTMRSAEKIETKKLIIIK
ncbi:MAG: T9SS type A sorting domain-containing protein [Candidatus Kapabacteria bacterium]|nr:T9SS type A sorting domain-containing protein [Candidatus Kapabacteria bacterium]